MKLLNKLQQLKIISKHPHSPMLKKNIHSLSLAFLQYQSVLCNYCVTLTFTSNTTRIYIPQRKTISRPGKTEPTDVRK